MGKKWHSSTASIKKMIIWEFFRFNTSKKTFFLGRDQDQDQYMLTRDLMTPSVAQRTSPRNFLMVAFHTRNRFLNFPRAFGRFLVEYGSKIIEKFWRIYISCTWETCYWVRMCGCECRYYIQLSPTPTPSPSFFLFTKATKSFYTFL